MSLLLTLTLAVFLQPSADEAPGSAPSGKAEPASASSPAKDAPSTASSPAAAPSQPVASSQAIVDSRSNADEPASRPADGPTLWDSGALGFMIEGGIFMWPILAMGIIATAVIIERYRSLKMLSTDSAAIRNQVRQLLEQDRVEEAVQFCDREQGPVPAILLAGMRKFLVLRRLQYDPGKIEEQVVKAMDDYSVHIVAALERHLPVLATVSSAAPMLGFLGTVSGMIASFGAIEAIQDTNIVEAAAAGIKEALLTTLLGLVVGIPAFVAFNYFTSVINGFVLDVEESATELVEAVTLQMALERHGAAASPPMEAD